MLVTLDDLFDLKKKKTGSVRDMPGNFSGTCSAFFEGHEDGCRR